MRWLNWMTALCEGYDDNEPGKDVQETAPVKPLIGIQGRVITACVCGAPGVWKSKHDPDWQHVPGVLLPRSDERIGRWVGTTCPNCGRRRTAPEKPVVLMRGKPGWLLFGHQ